VSEFTGFTPDTYADPERAYAAVTAWVEVVAEENSWTEMERFSVLDTVDAAKAAADLADTFTAQAWDIVGELNPLVWAYNEVTGTQDSAHHQADVFWAELVTQSAKWYPPGSDAMRRTIGAAAVTLNSIHEQEQANALGYQLAGAAAQTADDIKQPATDPKTWLAVAAAAVVVLVVLTKVR